MSLEDRVLDKINMLVQTDMLDKKYKEKSLKVYEWLKKEYDCVDVSSTFIAHIALFYQRVDLDQQIDTYQGTHIMPLDASQIEQRDKILHHITLYIKKDITEAEIEYLLIYITGFLFDNL
ncbi:MAG: hypothetical protein ACK5HS_02575 [Mycoplasmatales bacterium]